MEASAKCGREWEQGFTLLELIIAMGILALASLIVMPLVSRPAGDAALVATARKLASDMRVARASAIRNNDERTLTIDIARRRFKVDGVTGNSAIGHGIAIDFRTLQKELVSPHRGRIRFFADGSSTGGNIVLRAGPRTVTVDLDWMTGHASVGRSR
jgi:general secretion pathway protein H